MTPPRRRVEHAGKEGAGQGHHRLAVDPHHLGLALDRELAEAPAQPEAGVVDQQVHLDAELLDPAEQLGGLAGEVAGDDVCGGREPVGELPQALLAAGDEHQLVAAGGELPRELLADARRRARYQCRLGHGGSLWGS